MKQAILLHGTGGSDTDYFWFEDTKKFLEQNGYAVWWPLLPNTNKPSLQETVEYIEEKMPAVDEDSIIIAHSSACPLILHMLQYLQIQLKQVVLVAGYYQSISDESTSMLPSGGFEWDEIRNKAQNFVFINSDNDPWKCNDEQARGAAEALQAPLIINFGQGHMGSASFKQPYREFPLLKKLLEVK